MVKLYELETIDRNAWNELINNAINSSIFNTIEWMELWQNSYKNVKSLFLIYGNYEAGLPIIKINKILFNNYYSMPYGDYGGIIMRKKKKEYIKIIEELKKMKNVGKIVITDFYNINELPNFNKKISYTHILPLSKLDDVWKTISTKKRNKIKQAEKFGIEVNTIENENIPLCYEILKETAKRHKRKIQHTIKFYYNLLKFMKKYLIWKYAKKDNKIIATAIQFAFKNNIIYWNAASIHQYLSYHPNEAIIFDTIKWACNEGYEYYNFGASPTRGVERFKEEWGAKKKYYITYYKENTISKVLSLLKKTYKK